MGDEDFYQAALQELDSGNADEGLLAKAWVKADGDESLKKVEYVKLRVSQLKATRIKRTAAAAGSAAMTVAPSLLGLTFYVAKVVALVSIAAAGVAALSELTGEQHPGNAIGSVLAGVLVIYLMSRLIEWALLNRILRNQTIVVISSTTVSLLLIVALWFSGVDKPYAVHPNLLLSFLLASVILALGRTFLPGADK